MSDYPPAPPPKPGSGPIQLMIPDGDNRPRHVCGDCGFVHYRNPLVVVGAVCTWDEKILLCRRSIDPRSGYWTIPAGFLELNESAAEGAAREALEEACATIEIGTLLAVYNIPRISQIQLIYRARLASPDIAAGDESLEVGLFDWADIPWDDLAFPSVHWALKQFRETAQTGDQTACTNPPGTDHITRSRPEADDD